MELPKAPTAELFYGLRRDSRKPRPRSDATISNAKERPKSSLDAKRTTAIDSSLESIKSEIMLRIATLEASLLAEIHESRVREEKLRNGLAKSRVVAKVLQAKLINCQHDRAERGTGHVRHHKPEQSVKPGPLPSSTAKWPWVPPPDSRCGDLRQLARNQVIRSVQDISPHFTLDLELYSYGGYIPWARVLQWLEDHPETVDTIGLNLDALRTI